MNVQPRVIYARWTADRLHMMSSHSARSLSEPPHLVLNEKGLIYALGQEAEAAGKEPGKLLFRFESLSAIRAALVEAGTLFGFCFRALAYESVWRLLAAKWPPFRNYCILHPFESTAGTLAAEDEALLREVVRVAQPREVFLWSGEELDMPRIQAGYLEPSSWMGPAPRWVQRAQ